MKPSASQPSIAYRSNMGVYAAGEAVDPMVWARRLQFPIVEFRHAVVGPEWGSEGRLEGDYLHHVNLVVRGEARLLCRDRWWVLRPGVAYWFPGNTPNRRECSELYEAYYFKFRCEWFAGVDFLLDWPGRGVRELGPWEPSDWVGEWRLPLGVNACLRLQAQLALWMARAVPDLGGIVQRHVEERARFREALAVMESRLDAGLRMSDVAAVQGVGLHAFSMAFRRAFGVSPKAYFSRKLNESIVRWVTDTELSMNRIAEQFGFSDEYYFNRFFTKMNGVSPLRYRKRTRERRAGEV